MIKDISLVPYTLHLLLFLDFSCLEPKDEAVLLCFWWCTHHEPVVLSEQRLDPCLAQELGLGLGLGLDCFWRQISRASCIPFHFACLEEEAKGPLPLQVEQNVLS